MAGGRIELPTLGFSRLDSLKEGKWQRYQPRPVLLPIQSFMEKDTEKVSHWFDMKAGEVVQGLLNVHDGSARVYVVTTDTPAEFSYIHDRWPRVIQTIHQAKSFIFDL